MGVIAVWDGVSGIGFNLCVDYLDNFRLSKWSRIDWNSDNSKSVGYGGYYC